MPFSGLILFIYFFGLLRSNRISFTPPYYGVTANNPIIHGELASHYQHNSVTRHYPVIHAEVRRGIPT